MRNCFIEVPAVHNSKVAYINVAHIVAIRPCDDRAHIEVITGTIYAANLRVDQVMELIPEETT